VLAPRMDHSKGRSKSSSNSCSALEPLMGEMTCTRCDPRKRLGEAEANVRIPGHSERH